MMTGAEKTGIGIPGELIDRVFPFHVAIDGQLRVIQVGASMARIAPALVVGASLADNLTLQRPNGDLTVRTLRAASDQPFILRLTDTGIRLRGQFLPMPGGVWLFLGSPWFDSSAEIDAAGLSLSDYAVHDPMAELLMIGQTQQMAIRDLNELNERLERLSVERDTVLRLSPQGFAAFDAEGRLSYCNPSFEDMTGSQRTSLEGVHMRKIDEMFDLLTDAAQQVTPLQELEDGRSDEVQLTHPRQRTLTRSLQRMRGVDAELQGWVLSMRDVTREREIDRMKSEFLSTAAHELRTPMTSVRGFAELLMYNEYDAAMTREIAETIHRQSELLVHIVNELLDIARIEAQQGTDFVFEPQPVHDLVKQTVSALHVPDDDRVVRIIPLSGPSPIVRVDVKKTILALTNVLSNAYKYSPDGGDITVSFTRRAVNGRDEAGIVVSDQGIGMNESEVNRLFERFYRADPSGAIPGTGLGMSLVRDIIEIHNGNVEVSSAKGKGTTVSIFLPEVEEVSRRCAG